MSTLCLVVIVFSTRPNILIKQILKHYTVAMPLKLSREIPIIHYFLLLLRSFVNEN